MKDVRPYTGYHNKAYIPLHSNYVNWHAPEPYFKSWYRPSTNYVGKPIYNTPKTYSSRITNPNKYRDLNWRQRELYRSRRDLYNHIEGMAEK